MSKKKWLYINIDYIYIIYIIYIYIYILYIKYFVEIVKQCVIELTNGTLRGDILKRPFFTYKKDMYKQVTTEEIHKEWSIKTKLNKMTKVCLLLWAKSEV